jgi:hypothetical protein
MLIPIVTLFRSLPGFLIDRTVCFPDSLYRAARQFTYRRAPRFEF